MTPPQFCGLLKPYAQRVETKLGIAWQALVAQAALETGWLAHPIKDKRTGLNSYNLFGIKWTGLGEYVISDTIEYINGKVVHTEAKFRAYKDYAESFEDYCRFIVENPRYKEALAVKNDPEAYIKALQKAGYATDPQYAAKIISIMRKYILC
jgi:flagellar protein FlgJ